MQRILERQSTGKRAWFQPGLKYDVRHTQVENNRTMIDKQLKRSTARPGEKQGAIIK